jgi:hypothetical protein
VHHEIGHFACSWPRLNGVAYSQSNLDFQYLQIYSSPEGVVQYIALQVVRDPNWDGNYGSESEGSPSSLSGHSLSAMVRRSMCSPLRAIQSTTRWIAKVWQGVGARRGHTSWSRRRDLPISTW